jgi:hypothetical protein
MRAKRRDVSYRFSTAPELFCAAAGWGMSQAVRARVLIGAAVVTTLCFAPAVDAAFPGRDGLIAFTRADGAKPTQIYVIRPNG